jgi:hypothetical protein
VGPGPRVRDWVTLAYVPTRYSAALQGVSWGNLSLKRDSPGRCSHSHRSQRPFAFEFPRSHAIVATMALLDPPECLQPKVALNLVRNMLGWGVSALAGKICVGASARGDLTAGEFMLFVSILPSGLALPISSFFVLRWRSLASNLNTLCPTSSFRQPSSPTSAGCPWRRRSFLLLPLAFGGRMFTSLMKVDSRLSSSSIPRVPQLPGVESESCCDSIFLALMALVPPPTPPPFAKRSVAARPPHGRRSRRAQVRRTCSAPCAAGHRRPHRSDVARGVVQDVVRRGGGNRVLLAPWLGWSCCHPRRGTGARASSPWRTH